MASAIWSSWTPAATDRRARCRSPGRRASSSATSRRRWRSLPRGLSQQRELTFKRIAVGHDSGYESQPALTADVDLLVIGSRRWGPVARLLLGGTGEALVHGARCPLLIVPRPRD